MSKVAILGAVILGSLTLSLGDRTAYAGSEKTSEPIPFQTHVNIATPLEIYYPASAIVEIPVGKRLVVENIAAAAGVVQGRSAGCTLQANWSGAGGVESVYRRFVLSDRVYQGGGTDLLSANLMVLLYADRANATDSAIEVFCYTDSAGANIGVTFTGYLQPLPRKW